MTISCSLSTIKSTAGTATSFRRSSLRSPPSGLVGISSPTAHLQPCGRPDSPLTLKLEVKASENVFGNQFQFSTNGEPFRRGGCTISNCLAREIYDGEISERRRAERKAQDVTCQIISGTHEDFKPSQIIFGNYFQILTYKEPHDKEFGCTISGCPARVPLSEADVQVELDKSGLGRSINTSTGKEESITCQIRSGICKGMTTGASIDIVVTNTDQSGQQHGRPFCREIIEILAPGALAKKILKMKCGTEILAYVSQVHNVVLPEGLVDNEIVTSAQIENNMVRCPDPEYAQKMIDVIDNVRASGDSVGGVVTCIARNIPMGLGYPVLGKLQANLAKALLSLHLAKGFEFGSGFSGTFLKGSEYTDDFYMDKNIGARIGANRSGGIERGRSNGQTISLRLGFKPAPPIMKVMNTLAEDCALLEKGLIDMREYVFRFMPPEGEYDPCVLLTACPLVEAKVALVLVDQLVALLGSEMF